MLNYEQVNKSIFAIIKMKKIAFNLYIIHKDTKNNFCAILHNEVNIDEISKCLSVGAVPCMTDS